MNIEYELVRDEFDECCVRIMEDTMKEIEQKASHIPVESFIHNRELTTRPIEPAQKKVDRDCRFMINEISKPGYGKQIEEDGAAGRLAWLTWNKREKLEIFQIKDVESKRKYFIRLVIMLYEKGRGRYLNDSEKKIYEKALNILWDYFNDIESKWRDLTEEEENTLRALFFGMDFIDWNNYKENDLNDYQIISKSCAAITDWNLQRCYEIYCKNKIKPLQFLEKILKIEAMGYEDIDINNEKRRFRKYYKKFFEDSCKYDKESWCVQFPCTKIKILKLLYLASLNDKLLNGNPLGRKRKIFAKEFIKEIFGSDHEVGKCIEQAQILLALSGYFSIKKESLKNADYKMLDIISEYLSLPIEIENKNVKICNEISNNWIYIRCITERVQWIAQKKPLSKSRKEKILSYVKKLENMEVFHVKLLYSQSPEKFFASLSEDSWLDQQIEVVNKCNCKTLQEFEKMCEKVSANTNVDIDVSVLEIVNYNFKSTRRFLVNYRTLPTKYLKTVMEFMLDLHSSSN